MTTTVSTAAPEPVQAGRSPNSRSPLHTALLYGMNVLLTFVFIFPLLFMLVSSFKNNDQIFSDLGSMRAFLPVGELTGQNYQAVFDHSKFVRFVLNSLGIALVQVVLAVTINSMAAFALSRLKWRGQGWVLAIIIATLIIPGETIIMPLLLLVSKLPGLSLEGGLHFTQGWLNTYAVQIIPFVVSAFSIYLYYQFFQDIPRELDESAVIDGASKFQIYRHIVMPNAGPVTATVAILTFLGAWNSFLWPIMTVQSEDLRPVMVGLQYFFQRVINWGEIMAYTTMVTIPMLALFLIFQGAFVKSIASTGVKG